MAKHHNNLEQNISSNDSSVLWQELKTITSYNPRRLWPTLIWQMNITPSTPDLKDKGRLPLPPSPHHHQSVEEDTIPDVLFNKFGTSSLCLWLHDFPIESCNGRGGQHFIIIMKYFSNTSAPLNLNPLLYYLHLPEWLSESNHSEWRFFHLWQTGRSLGVERKAWSWTQRLWWHDHLGGSPPFPSAAHLENNCKQKHSPTHSCVQIHLCLFWTVWMHSSTSVSTICCHVSDTVMFIATLVTVLYVDIWITLNLLLLLGR